MGECELLLRLRPKEWGIPASPFLQGLMQGGNGLPQPVHPLLAIAEDHKRGAQTGFGKSPVERHAVAGFFLQRLTKSGNRLLHSRYSAFPLSENLKDRANVILGPGPV